MATVTKYANAHTAITTGYTDPTNAYADDTSYATAAPAAKNSEVSAYFGFPAFSTGDIPTGSTINSVKVECLFKVDTTASIATQYIQVFITTSGVGSEQSNATEPTTDTVLAHTVTAGVTLANLRNADEVRARLRSARGNDNDAVTFSIDYVLCTVDYTAPTPPTVTTQAVTVIAETSFTGNGNITDIGGANATTRGFCYTTGTSGDPTTADSTASDTGSFGTGAYTKSITSLTAATAYRVRAYAINPGGTSYGTTVQAYTTPTVALSTPADTATISDSTPDLDFVATAPVADTDFEVQVDEANTFNSHNGSPLIYRSSVASFTSHADTNFTNSTNGGDTRPFTAGDTIRYAVGTDQRILGATSNASSSDAAKDYVVFEKFVASASGTINKMNALVAVTGNVKFALYSDNAGEPDALLNSTTGDSVTGDFFAIWRSVTFPDTAVTAGTTYWIAFITDTLGTTRYYSNAAHAVRRYKADTYGTYSFPSSYNSTGFASDADPQDLIYASGNITLPDDTYYWRVRALSSGQATWGSWATTRSFTLSTASTYTLTADQASFTHTGQAAGLKAQRKLTATQASFAHNGQATGLKAQRLLTAEQASFDHTGQDITFHKGFSLVAAQASFALTGVAAGLRAARKLVATQASYALNGQAANLNYEIPKPGPHKLTKLGGLANKITFS